MWYSLIGFIKVNDVTFAAVMDSNKLNTIEEALEDIKQGKLLIVVDDEDRENEGDFVTIWDFTSASYVNKISDTEYEQVEPLCYLTDEEKDNFGKLMVYDIEYNGILQLNENLSLVQDLILSSVKDNKLIAINSLHTRII